MFLIWVRGTDEFAFRIHESEFRPHIGTTARWVMLLIWTYHDYYFRKNNDD